MYKEVKAILEAEPLLKGKVFPIGFVVDSVSGDCCCYSVSGPNPYRSLSGKLHHWTASITADILCRNYDSCQSIYAALCEKFGALAEKKEVIMLEVTCPEPDAYAGDVDRYRKRMKIDIDWRPAP